jgi:hypothetical protein
MCAMGKLLREWSAIAAENVDRTRTERCARRWLAAHLSAFNNDVAVTAGVTRSDLSAGDRTWRKASASVSPAQHVLLSNVGRGRVGRCRALPRYRILTLSDASNEILVSVALLSLGGYLFLEGSTVVGRMMLRTTS